MADKASKQDVVDLRREVASVRKELEAKASKADVASLKEEILHHFDAMVENLVQEFKGANADELSLLRDYARNHEERISSLEKSRDRS